MIGSPTGIPPPSDDCGDLSSQYNRISYPSHAYPETHPDRLAVMAVLFGLDPPAVQTCRILDIGCGDGSNLIPIALSLPEAQCVGIDLASKPIEIAQSFIKRTGVHNAKCDVMDVRHITEAFGKFDYIIAHGFFSWVPPDVQHKLLSICRQNLTPTGVAFISYNTLPGGHIRETSRELMLFHLQQTMDVPHRVKRGTAFLREMHDMITDDGLWKLLVQEELERLTKRDTNATFHDELGPIYSPIYFKDFVDTAAQFGLQFLSEASLDDMITPPVKPEVAERLEQLANGDLTSFHQYLDFTLCRSFRRTLLCNRAIRLHRDALPQRLEKLWIASPLVRSSGISDGGYEFRNQRGKGTYTTKNHIMLSVLDRLQALWPHAEPFDSLLKRISKPLPAELKQQAIENLAPNLLMLAAGGLVDLRSYPIPVAGRISRRPMATPLERIQAQEGTIITTLLHTQVEIADEQVRFLLQLLDGTRDRTMLVEAFVSNYPNISRQASERQVDSVLQSFYKLGVLTAS